MIKTASLTPAILAVVKDKGTEPPFTGIYTDFGESGSYLCRQCGLPLFRATSKFHSNCGWPSFDEEVANSIKMELDADLKRTEILCARCDAHLGHVFRAEGFTSKNIRHCVNSISLDFVSNIDVTDTEEAIFAAGCFWGVEYYFKALQGVVKVEVGYSGGYKDNPNYQEVCAGTTGHIEVIRVLYDKELLDYEALVKYFFEIHDPTQKGGQGPDIGEQYISVIFYYDEKQKAIAQKIITLLQTRNFAVATQLRPVSTFWPAEKYHQDYYQKTGKVPYCHRYVKLF